jgi:hypothetical protein
MQEFEVKPVMLVGCVIQRHDKTIIDDAGGC